MRSAVAAAACLTALSCAAPAVEVVDLSRHFRGTQPIAATFVLLDGRSGAMRLHDPERARMRFRPASTFKIANSLIALETGVVSGPDFTLPWDSVAVPRSAFFPASWAREQTLRSAFRNSVVWYYQELARRVGEPRMREWLHRLEYGNENPGGGIDRFWLSGDLRISPDEQVRWLRRFHRGELPVSRRSRDIVREMMLLADSGGYRIYGKTGTSDVTPTRENGWLVGFVEAGDGVQFYALNIEGETVWEDWPPQRRTALVTAILRDLAVIP